MSNIKIYNTLTGSKETFAPLDPPYVKMYVCGPTTYNLIHLGNARPLVVFDTVRRYLLYRGFRVIFIQNFTDIDDKIINRAQQEGLDPQALAQQYIDEFFTDAQSLNVLPADYYPRVSEHIAPIIDAIELLIQRGAAYQTSRGVYFAVRQFPGYGQLSGRSLADLQAGARIEIDEDKKDPLDFALWKTSKPGEPSWDSPWGLGRPGWHIECSVMSTVYLGEHFDIHGGGNDLIFPHHENELAQAEACTGRTFCSYWMHNGFITVNQEKMSKSLNNFFLVRQLLEQVSAEVVRFYLLGTHYRSPLDFDLDKLKESSKGLERIKSTIERLAEQLERQAKGLAAEPGSPQDQLLVKVIDQGFWKYQQAMDDDFNTSLALASVFEVCRELNTALSSKLPVAKLVLLRARHFYKVTMQDIFGLRGQDQVLSTGAAGVSDNQPLMQLILDLRQEARARKDWGAADLIRDRLQHAGFVLEDTPAGARWKRSQESGVRSPESGESGQ